MATKPDKPEKAEKAEVKPDHRQRDLDSAVQYAQQALAIKGVTPTGSKKIQRHLESFQQHKPIRL